MVPAEEVVQLLAEDILQLQRAATPGGVVVAGGAAQPQLAGIRLQRQHYTQRRLRQVRPQPAAAAGGVVAAGGAAQPQPAVIQPPQLQVRLQRVAAAGGAAAAGGRTSLK
jgi:cell division ATPase FtsA